MTSGGPVGAPRVCYLVLSHTEPGLVARLCRVLNRESAQASVLVRHDQSSSRLDSTLLADLPGVRLLPESGSAPWGSWQLTLASLRAVGRALEEGGDWDWLVLLSGTSYPLQPLSDLAVRLGTSQADAWFSLAGASEQTAQRRSAWRPFGADRARYSYHALPYSPLWERPSVQRPLLALTGRQPLGGFSFQERGAHHPRTTPKLAVLKPRSVFRGDVVPLRASQWFAVSRVAALRLAELVEPSHPWHAHFSRSYMSDETAPASWLRACGLTLRDEATHAYHWPSGASPSVLTEEHLPWVLQQQSPFVRKVSLSRAPRVLDEIDKERVRRATS